MVETPIQDLESSFKTLSNVGVILLFAAGIVGGAIAAVAWRTNQVSNRLQEAQKIEVAKLTLDLRNIEKDLAVQQERAANAERALEELRERLKDRTLSPEQRKKLTSLLKNAPHKQPVEVKFAAKSREAEAFASQLVGALRDAGWTVTHFTHHEYLRHTETGLILQFYGDVDFKEDGAMRLSHRSADCLYQALSDCGVSLAVSPGMPRFEAQVSNPLILIVAYKPEPLSSSGRQTEYGRSL